MDIRQTGGALVMSGVSVVDEPPEERYLRAKVISNENFPVKDYRIAARALADRTGEDPAGWYGLNLWVHSGSGDLHAGVGCSQGGPGDPSNPLYWASCGAIGPPGTVPSFQNVPPFLGREITFEVEYSVATSTVKVSVPELGFEVAGIAATPPGANQTINIELGVTGDFSKGLGFLVEWRDLTTTLGGGDGYLASASPLAIGGTPYADSIEGPPGAGFLTSAGGQFVSHNDVLIPGLDGTQDVNAYLFAITLPENAQTFRITVYSPFTRSEIDDFLKGVGATARVDASFRAFKANGPGQHYTWLEPPVIEGDGGETIEDLFDQEVTVVDGTTDPGYVRPVGHPAGAVFEEHFEDANSFETDWVAVAPERIFGKVGFSFDQPTESPPLIFGNAIQSGGALYTEATQGLTLMFSRINFPMNEELEVSVKVKVPSIEGDLGILFFGFGSPLSEQGLGPTIACGRVGGQDDECTFTQNGGNRLDELFGRKAVLFENRDLFFKITFSRSPLGARVKGEILGLNTEFSFEGPYTPTSTSLPMFFGVIAGLDGTPDLVGVRWDDIVTSEPLARHPLFEMSASPLAVDGMPFDQPVFMLFVPETPSANPQIELVRRTVSDLLGKVAGGRPGPNQGVNLLPVLNLLTSEPSGEIGSDIVRSALGFYMNRDNTPVFLKGTERIHAVLFRNPATGEGATLLVAGGLPFDPSGSVPPEVSDSILGDEPKFFPNIFANEPGLAGFGGIVLNLYVGQGPDKPFKFGLPKRQVLAGIAVPEEIELAPIGSQPPAPGELPFLIFPAICLFADGSATDLSLLGSGLLGSDDPLPAALFKAFFPRMCLQKVRYASTHPEVAEFLSTNEVSTPFMLAKAPGETEVTVSFDGVSNTSKVRVVQPPPLNAGESGVSTDSELLQIQSPMIDRLTFGVNVPQTIQVGTRVKPFIPVEISETAFTCLNIHLFNKSAVGGDARANGSIEMRNKARIEGDAIVGPTGRVARGEEVKGGGEGEGREDDGDDSPPEINGKGGGKGKGGARGIPRGDDDEESDDKTVITGRIRRSPTVRDCGPINQALDTFAERVRAINNRGSLELKHKDTITLPEGEYYFENLTLKNKSRLMAQAGAKVVVGNALTVKNDAQILGSGEWFVRSGNVSGPPQEPTASVGLAVAPGGTDPGYLDFRGGEAGLLADEFGGSALRTDLWFGGPDPITVSGGYAQCGIPPRPNPCVIGSLSAWPALGPTSPALTLKGDLIAQTLGNPGVSGFALSAGPLGPPDAIGLLAGITISMDGSGNTIAALFAGDPATAQFGSLGTFAPGQAFHVELTYNHALDQATALIQAAGQTAITLSLTTGGKFRDGMEVQVLLFTGTNDLVLFDRVETNMPLSLPPYAASRSPLQLNGVPYTSLTIFMGAPQGPGAIFLLPKPGEQPGPGNLFFVLQDDTRVNADGVTDIHAALMTFVGGCGPDAPPETARVTLYTTIDETTLRTLTSSCIALDAYRPTIFKANGYGSNYTWTLPPQNFGNAPIEPPTEPTVVLKNNAVFNGVLIGPRATVKLKNKARFNGALIAGHYVGKNTSTLSSPPGFVPKTVFIPLAGRIGVAGGGGFRVKATLAYQKTDFGVFGTAPRVVSPDISRVLVGEAFLTGSELPDPEGFYSLPITMMFDARTDTGSPLESSSYSFGGRVEAVAGTSPGGGFVLASAPITGGLVKVDNTPPRQMVFTPRNNQIMPIADLFVLGFTDDLKALSFVRVNEDAGAPTDIPSGMGLVINSTLVEGLPFPIPLPLPGMPKPPALKLHEGDNQVAVVSRDTLLNESRRTFKVTVDTVPPEVRMPLPIDATFTQQPSTNVSALMSDHSARPELVEGSGLDMTTLRLLRAGALDSMVETPAGSLTRVFYPLSPSCTLGSQLSALGYPLTADCSLLTNLEEGVNIFRSSASDMAGNRGADARAVTLDRVPPVAKIVLPPNGSCLNKLDPLLIVNWRDPEPEGRVITAPLVDPLTGAEGTVEFEFPPPGFIAPLGSGFDLNTAVIEIDEPDVDAPVSLNQLFTVTSDFAVTGALANHRMPLLESNHLLRAKVTDHVGNMGEFGSSNFTLDVSKPIITPSHAPPGPFVPTPDMTLHSHYIDPLSKVDGSRCDLDLDTLSLSVSNARLDTSGKQVEGVALCPGSRAYPCVFSPVEMGAVVGVSDTDLSRSLGEGLIVVRWYIRDLADPIGNEGYGEDRFVIDTRPPELTFLQGGLITNKVPEKLVVSASDRTSSSPIQGNTGVTPAPITLTVSGPKSHTFTAVNQFTATDDPIDLFKRFPDGPHGDFTAAIPEDKRSVTEFPDGVYTVSTSVSDRVGNKGNLSGTFRIDRVPPVVHEIQVSSYQTCVEESVFGGCDELETRFVVEAKVTDNVMMNTVKFEAGEKSFDLQPSIMVADWWYVEIPAATYPTTGDAYLVALDKAGNEVRVKRISKDSGGDVSPPGVDAKLSIEAGALAKDAFINLTDVKLEDAVVSLGGSSVLVPYNSTSFSPGQLKYLGGAKLGLGGQFTNKPLKLCVPRPSGYSLPADGRQVLVARVLNEDANKDGHQDLAVVDGVQLETVNGKEMICDPHVGLPGVREDGTYIVVELDQKTQVVTGTVAPGTKLRLGSSSESCSPQKLFSFKPDPAGGYASVVCVNDLASLEIEILGTGEDVLGSIHGVTGTDTVVNAGSCIVTSDLRPTKPTFPAPDAGGPPANLSAVEFELPLFTVDRGTSDLTDLESRVRLTTVMKVPDLEGNLPAQPNYTFQRTQTVQGSGRIGLVGPFDVIGYTSSISFQSPGSISLVGFNEKTLSKTCFSRSALSTKSISVEITAPSETYDELFGGNDAVPNYHDLCTPSNAAGLKDKPPSDTVPCFPAVDLGCHDGLNTHDPWQIFYASSDPMTCQPSVAQIWFMLLKKAGIQIVATSLTWVQVEPVDVTTGSPAGTTLHFNDRDANMDAYMRLARKYNIQVKWGFLGADTPWWISSCCEDLGPQNDEAEEIQCRRSLASETDCGVVCAMCDFDALVCPDTSSQLNEGCCNGAGCCADKALAADAGKCDLACLQKKDGSPGKDRSWLTPNKCAPRDENGPVGALEALTPTYGKLMQFVGATVARYAPGGGLASGDPDWPAGDTFGITDWAFGNELENPEGFGTLRNHPPGALPPNWVFYGAYKEYKDIFKVAYNFIRGTLKYDHRLHGPGPTLASGQASGGDCDYYDGSLNPKPDGKITIQELAERCHSEISPEHLYQVLRDPAVSGYSFNDEEMDHAVIGFHWYQLEGPNPSATPGGNRQRAYEVLRNLSCLFPEKDIWATEGGNCNLEELRRITGDPLRAKGDCDPNAITSPSDLAQAGYLVGFASYAGPDAYTCTNLKFRCPGGKTCPALTGLPATASSALKRLFWYRPMDVNGRGLFVVGHGGTPTIWPVFHAMAPAQGTPVILDTTMPFRTGIQRSDLLPRAYFPAALESFKKYKLRAKAGNLPRKFEEKVSNFDAFAVSPNTPFSITVITDKASFVSINPTNGSETGDIIWLEPNEWTTIADAATSHDFTFEIGLSGTYSFAIVPDPKKLYVPTEGETKGFFDDVNEDFGTTLENRLSLIPPDPDHPGLSDIVNSQVLTFAEGAYVEGVIRFEVVPLPAQVARRPNARAP